MFFHFRTSGESIMVFDFSGTKGMESELGLSGAISSNSEIKWQQETCICDLGDQCNHGNLKAETLNNAFILIFLLAVNIIS